MNDFSGESLPVTELRHPSLCDAYEYWCRARGDRELPSRRDFLPEEMKPYIARVMLIDVSYRPLDFVYRVFGSEIAQAHGKDFRAKSVRELEPAEFSRLVWQQYLDVVNELKPHLHGVTFSSGGRHEQYHRLTVPLSTNGVVIDKLLAVSIEDKKFWKATGHAKATRSYSTGTSG